MRTVSWKGNLMVAIALAFTPLMALIGAFGQPRRSEVFDAKQVTVWRVGRDGLRIREVVDEDFGSKDKHGYERTIPDDFGVVTDVTATSPDAPADLSVDHLASLQETWIRIGDPNRTVSGRHRYVLTYTLPAAQLSTGRLALDIIGSDDQLVTKRFEVDVVGLSLRTPTCNAGRFGTSGGCTLADLGGDRFQTVVSPLEPYQGITIGGIVADTLGPATQLDDPGVALPALPAPHPDHRALLALAVLLAELLVGGAFYAVYALVGRDQVAAGGAADAAFATSVAADAPPPPASLMSDRDVRALATIEFAPPAGIEPWQGAALLHERLDDRTTTAWFGQRIATGALTLDTDLATTMRAGPEFEQVPPEDHDVLAPLFATRTVVPLGSPDDELAAAAQRIRTRQIDMLRSSGWWRRLPPDLKPGTSTGLGLAVVALLLLGFTSLFLSISTLLPSPAGAVMTIVTGVLITLGFVPTVYLSMLGSRSATGSALMLRTESFRTFLHASEARHVEWAWKHGLVREYTVWAVALGEAEAWGRVLAAAAIAPTEVADLHQMLSTSTPDLFRRSYVSHTVAVARSSGGGRGWSGGGFSGGSVGGGGGGGSSGSW